MIEKRFNPVIKAVQSLKKLSADIESSNIGIRECNDEITRQIAEAGKLIVTSNDSIVINLLINEKARLRENITVWIGTLQSIEDKFKNEDYSNLSESWQTHNYYNEIVINSIGELKNVGSVILVTENLRKWVSIWQNISCNVHKIRSVAEAYNLKLGMMEVLKPEEIDALTMDILKYIPWNYSDNDAYKYEKEYLEAYKGLKEAQANKKSLWNKVLDVLAKGVEETPAHRMEMRRWMDGISA